ncbi:hypothetical protein FITA111629_14620 [Filibacter tadaridae]|uniref:Uncharacterized protein n=1 Tax=Filibacter tadaridae TaxID=2483811 RepID=A0A3P5Y033_9BACL|nr:hypothetical protein FILTAD_03058 [Filibacter tadaridae]
MSRSNKTNSDFSDGLIAGGHHQARSGVKNEYLCTVSIIDERTVYLNLSFEKAIRSRKQIFCLSLIMTHNQFYVPNSLLNLRFDKGINIHKGYPFCCIYSIDARTILCEVEEFDTSIYFEKMNT